MKEEVVTCVCGSDTVKEIRSGKVTRYRCSFCDKDLIRISHNGFNIAYIVRYDEVEKE
ncbi:MAG: hypothetical protein ACTSPO_15155 [Candidatus Heimdallarchaeaceae archaeon]